MAQFDVHRNPNSATRARIPYLLDVQSDLLDPLATRVVVPLCKPEVLSGKPAERLNPAFEIEGRKLLMLTPELAGVSRKALGERVTNLTAERAAIIAALDLVLDGKVAIKPFVETHPLDDINQVFDAVHHREISRRAVLVPA